MAQEEVSPVETDDKGPAKNKNKTSDTNTNANGQSTASLPPIASVFLVKFDNRKGYTLAWQRSIDTLNIEGVVEFKSLPSGLHNVREDLVYFVHEGYAGVSAFYNREDAHAERNARMLALGVLVPLESGRLGRSWLHAENLKSLCRDQAETPNDYSAVEKYWDEHRTWQSITQTDGTQSGPETKPDVSKVSAGYQAARSMSVGTIPIASNHTLSAHHPALALIQMLHLFGPLIMPLYRAALLRKRILLMTEAPVEHVCNFVYNISVLSSIPRTAADSIHLESSSDLRLRPLFNVGITDIPLLSAWSTTQDSDPAVPQPPGWIASTTDDVLCTKPDLFDVLVQLPGADALRASPRKYPKIFASSQELTKSYPKVGLRASQRDAKRYRSLASNIQLFPSSSAANAASIEDDDEEEGVETASVASSVSSGVSHKSVVEPQSWSRIAYTSLVWWASAGDKKAGLTEAAENDEDEDRALLAFYTSENDDHLDHDDAIELGKEQEIAIVSFFHRLTGLIFDILGAAVKRTDHDAVQNYHDDESDDGDTTVQAAASGNYNDDDSQSLLRGRTRTNTNDEHDENDSIERPVVEINTEDMAHMGLDIWSDADRKFVEEMVSFWWGRDAVVVGGKVECCGIRLM